MCRDMDAVQTFNEILVSFENNSCVYKSLKEHRTGQPGNQALHAELKQPFWYIPLIMRTDSALYGRNQNAVAGFTKWWEDFSQAVSLDRRFRLSEVS